MTAQAALARQNAVSFEAKKTGFGQAQDGWSLTLRIQDHDVPANVRDAKKGVRFMVVLVEIGDDEQPVSLRQAPNAEATPRPATAPQLAPVGDEIKERRPFASLPLPQQAALRCNDPIYRAFLREICGKSARDENEAAEDIRDLCGVESRRDIRTGTEAEKSWLELEQWFAAWQTKERAMA